MKKTTMGGMILAPAILAGVGTFSVANASEVPVDVPQNSTGDFQYANGKVDLNTARQQILNETNAIRAQAGLPPVKLANSLNNVAQSCSQEQASMGYMHHCDGFANKFRPGWTTASENVAMGYSLSQVTEGWRTSPGHYRNMTDPQATHLGIGIAYDSQGMPYYTQNFAGYNPGTLPAGDEVNGSSTPAPETPAPAKPAPTTPAPAKPAPTIPAPTTPAPAAPADTNPCPWSPGGAAPETPAPAPAAPEVPAPVVPVSDTTPAAPVSDATGNIITADEIGSWRSNFPIISSLIPVEWDQAIADIVNVWTPIFNGGQPVSPCPQSTFSNDVTGAAWETTTAPAI